MTEKIPRSGGPCKADKLEGATLLGIRDMKEPALTRLTRAVTKSSTRNELNNSKKKEKVLLLANQNGKIKMLLANLNIHLSQPYQSNTTESIFFCLAPENLSKLFNKNSKKGGVGGEYGKYAPFYLADQI